MLLGVADRRVLQDKKAALKDFYSPPTFSVNKAHTWMLLIIGVQRVQVLNHLGNRWIRAVLRGSTTHPVHNVVTHQFAQRFFGAPAPTTTKRSGIPSASS